MLDPAARALEPLASDARPALRATLDKAPPALAAATGGLGRGRRLLASAHALATAATDTLPTLPRGLRAAAKLLRQSPPSLTRATALLRAASPAVPAALKLTRSVEPVLEPITRVSEDALPILRYIAPRGCDIENFGVVMRSMTGFGGVGTGPLGPSMEFRAQLLPAPEALAAGGEFVPAKKAAYATPCTYVSKPYPYVSSGGRR
jgi:hypothetical protein